MSVGDPTGNSSLPSSQLKRNLGLHSGRFWESWFSKGNMAHTALVGCIVFGAFKLLAMRSSKSNMPNELKTSHPCSTSQITALSHHGSCGSASAFVKRDLVGQLRKFWASLRRDLKYTNGVGSLQNTWPTVDLSRFSAVAAGFFKSPDRMWPVGPNIRRAEMRLGETRAGTEDGLRLGP
ncbi:hypothetical protein GW17_00013403 [Ensete ventricosum]|nr:hypothetical protein GW17_00013403 [Ensete ventricosum]